MPANPDVCLIYIPASVLSGLRLRRKFLARAGVIFTSHSRNQRVTVRLQLGARACLLVEIFIDRVPDRLHENLPMGRPSEQRLVPSVG